jgi:hypothetical protein
MRDTELLADLAHVALGPASVLHYAGAADHFQIGHSRQISQDLALHSIGEIGVLFLFAPVLKRKKRDALLGDRNWNVARCSSGNGRYNRPRWCSVKKDQRSDY